jgi:hypothetical protein
MLDNTASLKDLDAPLQGTQLLLCNPQQGKAGPGRSFVCLLDIMSTVLTVLYMHTSLHM